MDISVIIVSWNGRQYLIDCLKSLEVHTSEYTQEIIVVDNDSSDGSPEAVESQFLGVKLIRNDDNLGFAKANNIGIKASTGRYLFLVNSDVEVLGGCIEYMLAFMDKNPKVGMASPRVLNSDRTLQVSCRHFPSVWNNICQIFGFNKLFPKSGFFSEPLMKYWPHDLVKKVDVLSGCFWGVRRSALDEVGFLDEDFFFYGEDIDWCRRFHKAGWDVMFNPDAEAIHYGGASSDNAPIRFYLEMQKADLRYWNKHHGKSGQFSYWMIILIRHLLRIPFFLLTLLFRANRREDALFKIKRAYSCVCFLFGFNVTKE